MSTNYFMRVDECDACGRYEERHICKNLVMFRGYFTYDESGPPSPGMDSWQRWKQVLLGEADSIHDEYGVEYGIADFIAMVEATEPEARRSQYDWVVRNGRGRTGVVEPGADWLDNEGFSFYGGEFS